VSALSVDLHSHSTRSDGALTPTELVEHAAAAGVEVLGLTDHDTMAGVEEAMAAGARLGVEVVPGIELSVRVPAGTFHLLGWFRTPAPEPLQSRLDEIGAGRDRRNRRMVERLAELGVPVAWEDVARRAAGRIGRPHIADALVAAGWARDREDAFARWVGSDAPAYLPTGTVGPEDAVRLLKESGGATSIAHPPLLRLAGDELDDLLRRVADAGLDALEAHRGDQDEPLQHEIAALAARHGLLVSGGSDFHRAVPENPARRLGATGRPGLSREAAAAVLARRG
jgi:hypothetical protein